MKTILTCIIAIFITLTSYTSGASIALSDIIVDISSSTRKADIEIYNRSLHPIAVLAEVKEIINPGQENQRILDILQDEDFDNDTLIMDPSMFVLAARKKRLLRFMNLNSDIQTDKIYRVLVAPKENANPNSQSKKDLSAGVQVLLAYEVLVIIRPNKIIYDVNYSRIGNKLKTLDQYFYFVFSSRIRRSDLYFTRSKSNSR